MEPSRTRRFRGVGLGGALALTACLPAPAAAQDHIPQPVPPDTAALARAGIHVDWPFGSHEASRQPGDVIRVAVRSRRRTVRLALTRISNETGRPVDVVARRRLRRGVFRARLPRRWGTYYTLTLDAAGRQYRALIGTFSCPEQGRTEARLTIDRTSARRGEVIDVQLHNTGTTCISFGADYGWQRLRDGQWEPVPAGDRAWPAIAYGLYPGGVHPFFAQVWEELEPGPHRLVKEPAPPVQIEVLP